MYNSKIYNRIVKPKFNDNKKSYLKEKINDFILIKKNIISFSYGFIDGVRDCETQEDLKKVILNFVKNAHALIKY